MNIKYRILHILLLLSIIYPLQGDENYNPKASTTTITIPVSLWTGEEVTLSILAVYTQSIKRSFFPHRVAASIAKQAKKEFKNIFRPLSLKDFLKADREILAEKVLNKMMPVLKEEKILLRQLMITNVLFSEEIENKLRDMAVLEQQLYIIPAEQEKLTYKMEMISAKTETLEAMPPSDITENDILEQKRLLRELQNEYDSFHEKYDATKKKLDDLKYELGL